jgi:hypothetical protein
MSTTLEDEAIVKLCPLTMASEYAQKCFGSRCMAWRWDRPNGNDSPPYGFCGMAPVIPADVEDVRYKP